MCLIIYSPRANLPAKLDFRSAAADNSDGIGIMSADGIAKFNGRRSTKRAWNYAQYLSEVQVPFAVHFRFATHGKVCRELTHPFEVPESGDYVMHNGILGITAKHATHSDSDTSIYVREFMPYYTSRAIDRETWRDEIELDTWGSRLLVMSPDGESFEIVHESSGDWCEGIWYSNTYSLVAPETAALHWRPIVTPSRLAAQHRTPAKRSGFDWHDTTTWHLYPSQRVSGEPLNRFGDPDDVATWHLGDPEPFDSRDSE